jgi:hypothetical protein
MYKKNNSYTNTKPFQAATANHALPRFPLQPKGGAKGSASTSSSSSSGVSSGQPSPVGSVAGHSHKKLTWNPFRRASQSRDSTQAYEANVILR